MNFDPYSREDESIVWMMCHHLKAAVTLMEVCLENELVNKELLEEHLLNKRKEADTIWEQHMWVKFIEAINRPDNVVLFSPESRGPDS